MIDTVKFKITADPNILRCIRSKAIEFRGFDHETQKMSYQIFKKPVKFGSYHYGIIITVNDDHFTVEFSVPKYAYNHNVKLFDVSKFESVLTVLHREMEEFFKCTIEQPFFWELTRLDLCYAWRFYDDDTAKSVIGYIQRQKFARKTQVNYETSTMFHGTDYSVKFYMKGPEFYAHDYKRMAQQGYKERDDILAYSKGVVRYEITLRKDQIIREFGAGAICFHSYNLIQRDKIITILRNNLQKLLGLSAEVMNTQKIYDTLSRTQIKPENIRLYYAMYKLYTSTDPVDRSLFDRMPKTTRNRYKRIFKKYKLGIPSQLANTEIELQIPSPYGVVEFVSP